METWRTLRVPSVLYPISSVFPAKQKLSAPQPLTLCSPQNLTPLSLSLSSPADRCWWKPDVHKGRRMYGSLLESLISRLGHDYLNEVRFVLNGRFLCTILVDLSSGLWFCRHCGFCLPFATLCWHSYSLDSKLWKWYLLAQIKVYYEFFWLLLGRWWLHDASVFFFFFFKYPHICIDG